MMTGNNLAEMVVVLKTLPTKEACEALGRKVWESVKQKDVPDFRMLTMGPNDKGFDLSSSKATVGVAISTIVPNLRKIDPELHLDVKTLQQVKEDYWDLPNDYILNWLQLKVLGIRKTMIICRPIPRSEGLGGLKKMHLMHQSNA